MLLAACQTSVSDTAPEMTASQLADLSEKWEGKWAGAWGGDCTGSIEVTQVTATGADVVYAWDQCPDSGSTDTFGTFEDGALVVDLWGRTSASYRHESDDVLSGRYSRPRDAVTAEGRFKRQ
jgi:hypothetical protein